MILRAKQRYCLGQRRGSGRSSGFQPEQCAPSEVHSPALPTKKQREIQSSICKRGGELCQPQCETELLWKKSWRVPKVITEHRRTSRHTALSSRNRRSEPAGRGEVRAAVLKDPPSAPHSKPTWKEKGKWKGQSGCPAVP